MQNIVRDDHSKARAVSNLAFLLVDVLESAYMEANDRLAKENKEFKHEAKREFNLLLKHCRNLKRHIAYLSEATQECYGNDSDRTYNTLKLLLDRCGSDDMKLFKFYNYIKTFPSNGCFETDESVWQELSKEK